MTDTRALKSTNNESGTNSQLISTSEVATIHVTPIPDKATGIIVMQPGTTYEEHIYYREKDAVLGTLSGLVRDIENQNGGVGREHQANSPWETLQSVRFVNNLVDIIQEGFQEEMNEVTYVSGTSFTVKTNRSAFYTLGRILRLDGAIAIVDVNSTYSAGTGLTTVVVVGTVPNPLVKVEFDLKTKGYTDDSATGAEINTGISKTKKITPKALADSNYTLIDFFKRDIKFSAKTVSAAADRYTILSPNLMLTYFNSKQYRLPSQVALDLSVQATWDTITGTDYRTAVNRIGKDFYIYACAPVSGTIPTLLVSSNATNPSGFTTVTSKKIAGFHCLGIAVGTIAGHTLTGYVAGDILPQSVWDLNFKPQSATEGMVYDSGTGKWVDIYLVSVASGELASIYGATIADGASTPAFHWYKFAQWLSRLKKKLPDQHEFMSLSLGANQGTNITGSADPGTTGGHTDTAGRRMISNIGCEDTCGVLWQWGRDRGGGQSAAAFANAYDGNDTGVAGQHYLAPNCVIFGGDWAGVYCGSRGSYWSNGPLILAASIGARGVSEPVAL